MFSLYTRYPVTPTLSVDASQVKSICVLDVAVAVKFCGILGGSVSGIARVVTGSVFDGPDSLFAASTAVT